MVLRPEGKSGAGQSILRVVFYPANMDDFLVAMLLTGLALPSLVVVLTPRRRLPLVAAALLILLYSAMEWLGRPVAIADRGMFHGADLIFVAIGFGPAALALLFRATRGNIGSWAPLALSAIAVASVWTFVWIGPLLARAFGPMPVVAATLAVAAASLGLGIGRRWRAALVVGGSLLVLVVGTALHPVIAINRLERLARGSPYCVDTAAFSGTYRSVNTLADLTPLVLRGRESHGLGYDYHGLILVRTDRDRVYNWSYRRRMEAWSVTRRMRLACVPTRHFARKLPLV